MKVAEYVRYGSSEVVRVVERDRPVPGAGEVLVRVGAASITAPDVAARSGRPLFSRLFFGLTKPKLQVLGSDFAGSIVELGAGVSTFAVGDAVWGATGPRFGAHAEYVVVAANGVIARSPAGFSELDAAALVYGGLTALPFLRDGAGLRAGQRILVNGASGAVGSIAVQLAKHLGAEVTAVCGSRNADLVRSLGVDEVLDYETENFTRSGEQWDVVFDVVGRSSFPSARRVLSPSGVYLSAVPSAGTLLASRLAPRRAKILFTGLRADDLALADLVELGELALAGALVPVIDHAFPLAAAAEAHHRTEHGPKVGTVLITMSRPDM